MHATCVCRVMCVLWHVSRTNIVHRTNSRKRNLMPSARYSWFLVTAMVLNNEFEVVRREKSHISQFKPNGLTKYIDHYLRHRRKCQGRKITLSFLTPFLLLSRRGPRMKNRHSSPTPQNYKSYPKTPTNSAWRMGLRSFVHMHSKL